MVELYDRKSHPTVHFIYWIFGIRTYSSLPDMSFEFPIGKFMFSFSCLLGHYILSYICAAYLLDGGKVVDNNRTIRYVNFYGNILMTSICCIISWFHYEGIQNYTIDSAIAYKMLEKVGIPIYHSNKVVRALVMRLLFGGLFIIGIVSLNTITGTHKDNSLHINVIIFIVMNYGLIMTFFVESAFIVMVRFTSSKIQEINKLLESMITSSVQSPQHRKVMTECQEADETDKSTNHICRTLETDRRTMKIVKQCHQRLVSICYDIGRTYGLQILWSVTVSFIIITLDLYSTYLLITSSEAYPDNFQEIFITNFYWLWYFGLRIYAFCSTCQESNEEAMRTGDIICELYDECSLNDQVRAEIRDFNLQLVQNPLRYTAFGFFPIDFYLIQGVVASSTTYLVIMIQLRDMPLEEEDALDIL